jgi:hypothetical protein
MSEGGRGVWIRTIDAIAQHHNTALGIQFLARSCLGFVNPIQLLLWQQASMTIGGWDGDRVADLERKKTLGAGWVGGGGGRTADLFCNFPMVASQHVDLEI